MANKRWAKGVTINASYTYVPRWNEVGGYVDAVSGLLNDTVYFSHRPHRFTGSGVWELPWYRDERSILGYLLGGWSIAPAVVYQSGQPWDMPGNVDLAPGIDPKVMALDGKKDGQFIYGVKPCIGVFNTAHGPVRSGVDLDRIWVHRAVLPDSPNVPAPHGDEPLRRVPAARVFQYRHELREDDADHQGRAFPECVSRHSTSSTARSTTSVSYNQDTNSADFGRINRNATGQSGFQRFVQMGFRLIF